MAGFCVDKFNFAVKGQQGELPCTGLGTVGLNAEQIANAIKAGYRMIDTALLYENHTAVRDGVKLSGVSREELFIISKVGFFPSTSDSLWMYNANNVKGNEAESIDKCLQELGVDYIDLLMIHNPCVSEVEYSTSCLPHFFELFNLDKSADAVKPVVLPNGRKTRDLVIEGARKKCAEEIDTLTSFEKRKESWLKMEEALATGKCRFIGVSNYPGELLQEMARYATVMPAVNEIEFHPRFAGPTVRATAKELGCVLVGYGNIKSGLIHTHDVIHSIAKKLDRTSQQVVLRWMFQSGVVSIPRSSNLVRLQENSSIFDFAISSDDMQAIDTLNEDHPYYWDPVPNVLACSPV